MSAHEESAHHSRNALWASARGVVLTAFQPLPLSSGAVPVAGDPRIRIRARPSGDASRLNNSRNRFAPTMLRELDVRCLRMSCSCLFVCGGSRIPQTQSSEYDSRSQWPNSASDGSRSGGIYKSKGKRLGFRGSARMPHT